MGYSVPHLPGVWADRGWRLLCIAGAVAAFGAPVRAGQAPAPAPAPEQYAGYVLGLHVFDMTLGVALQPASYRVEASFRVVGALSAFWHAEGATSVEGGFSAGRAVPREMISTGRYGGEAHSLRMGWTHGAPGVLQMAPPPEKDREAVPAGDQANTVDTLSVLAELMQRVAETGRCDTAARTFDGTRLAEFSARTAGDEILKPTERSSFQGAALRCDLTVRMTGGFLRDEDNAAARRAKRATVWLARVRADGAPIPVRVAFYADGSPGATVYVR